LGLGRVVPHLAVHQDVVGVDAGGQGVAVAVEDGAAVRVQDQAALVFVLSLFPVFLVADELEVSQAPHQAESGYEEKGYH
jgi:hypothetical protein